MKLNRRKFLIKSSVAAGGIASLAGCMGGDQAPPRESEVFEEVDATTNALQVQLDSQPKVQTRKTEADSDKKKKKKKGKSMQEPTGVLAALSPVGVASAKGRGRGGGARGVSARGRHGRAKWKGGAYAAWWDDHDDEVEEVQCEVAAVGVARLAKLEEDEDDLPGAGKPPEGWDKTWKSDVTAGEVVKYTKVQQGWWRVGSHIVEKDGDREFGWEAVDFQVVKTSNGYEIKNKWKVSPRL